MGSEAYIYIYVSFWTPILGDIQGHRGTSTPKVDLIRVFVKSIPIDDFQGVCSNVQCSSTILLHDGSQELHNNEWQRERRGAIARQSSGGRWVLSIQFSISIIFGVRIKRKRVCYCRSLWVCIGFYKYVQGCQFISKFMG